MKKHVFLVPVPLLLAAFIFAEESSPRGTAPARLSLVSGEAYIQRAADLGYEEAVANMPISEGDRLSTANGRAEVYLGRKNYIRLDKNTKVDFINLSQSKTDITRIRVWAGNVYLDVNSLDNEKNIELHTNDASLYLLDEGLYRVDVRENRESEILVYRGLLEVAAEEGSLLIKPEQRLEVSEGRFSSRPSSFIAVAEDSFDRWNESRGSQIKRQFARSYLPEELEDFECELEEYGDWAYVPPYGYVWVPGGIDIHWRPYFYGRWTWISPWGWTWLPYEPWGWVTFHYGRWHWGAGIGWYWIPTRIWGPAWVSWFWHYDYFGWVPLSFYDYPVVIVNNVFYSRWTADYPYNSRALTVIHKDQLKARNVSEVALSQQALKEIGKISLSREANHPLAVKPESGRVSVEALGGKKVLLRKEERVAGSSPGGTTIEKGTTLPQERKIRKKKDESPELQRNEAGGNISRESLGYPSRSEIDTSRNRQERNIRPSPVRDRIYRYFYEENSSRRISSPGSPRDSSSLAPPRSSGSSSMRSSPSSSSRSDSRSGSVSRGTIKKKN